MRGADYLLSQFERGPLNPGLNELSQVCTEAPSRMVFKRQDSQTEGPFEACPADPSIDVAVEIQDQLDLPIPIADSFDWSVSSSSIAAVAGTGAQANIVMAGGLGAAAVRAEWTTCPDFPSHTNLYVGVAPTLVGPWLAGADVSQTGCQDPEEDFSTTYIEVGGEIEAQITNSDGTVTFNIFGVGWEGTATMECGGEGAAFSGSQTYTFEDGWGETEYQGTLEATDGPPGHRLATILAVTSTSEDMQGDTCYATGSGYMWRVDL